MADNVGGDNVGNDKVGADKLQTSIGGNAERSVVGSKDVEQRENNFRISLENNELGRQNNDYLQSIDQRLMRMEENLNFRLYRMEDKTEMRLSKIESELTRLKEDAVVIKLPTRPTQALVNGNFRLVFIILAILSFAFVLLLIYSVRGPLLH